MIKLQFSKDTSLSQKSLHVDKTDFQLLFQRGLKILDRENKLKSIKEIFTKKNPGLIQCSLTDDETIRVLNSDYRGLDKPTDVLSFSYYQYYKHKKTSTNRLNNIELHADHLIGEIIISIPTAKRQAKEHHMTLMQELQFLFVHGLLHIFDYDHETPDERKIMFNLQDEVLGTSMWREIIE